MSEETMQRIQGLLDEAREAMKSYEQERTETVQKALRESGIEAFIQQTNIELAHRRGKIEALEALLHDEGLHEPTPDED